METSVLALLNEELQRATIRVKQTQLRDGDLAYLNKDLADAYKHYYFVQEAWILKMREQLDSSNSMATP